MIPKTVPPTPLAGSAVDGSKIVHAAEVYKPNAKVPFFFLFRNKKLMEKRKKEKKNDKESDS